MPSGRLTSLVTFAQIRRKITHGNSADARHAGHLLEAELLITEDKGLHEALEFVTPMVAGAAEARLLNRGDPDLIARLAAAVSR